MPDLRTEAELFALVQAEIARLGHQRAFARQVGVSDRERRFLAIRAATDEPRLLSASDRTERLFSKWDGLLRRLAR